MVISTATINSDSFVYLKQLLCMIGIARLKRSIKIDGEVVDYTNLCKEAKDTIESLKLSFELPINVLRNDQSVINFCEIDNILSDLNIFNVGSVNRLHKQLVSADIFHKPNKLEIFNICFDNFENKNALWVDQRLSIAKILDQIEGMFNLISSYIQSETSTTTVSAAVATVITIESIDYVFSLAEAGENGFRNIELEKQIND